MVKRISSLRVGTGRHRLVSDELNLQNIFDIFSPLSYFANIILYFEMIRRSTNDSELNIYTHVLRFPNNTKFILGYLSTTFAIIKGIIIASIIDKSVSTTIIPV